LGEILYFQEREDLNDTVILKPQWVTSAISRVLESEQVKSEQGILERAPMEELWDNIESPLQQHFLRLMEQFDLSYPPLDNPTATSKTGPSAWGGSCFRSPRPPIKRAGKRCRIPKRSPWISSSTRRCRPASPRGSSRVPTASPRGPTGATGLC